MYRINPLYRNVLITADEVLFHAATEDNIGISYIQKNIINAEERFVRTAMGSDFYDDFASQKNRIITSANQTTLLSQINATLPTGTPFFTVDNLQVGMFLNAIELVTDQTYVTLWYQLLWKFIAECVEFMTIPNTWLRSAAQGQMKNNPEVLGGITNGQASASGDLKDVKFKMDKAIQDRIDPLQNALHAWLCNQKKKNPASYPLYKRECECDKDGLVSTKRKSDIMVDIYPKYRPYPEFPDGEFSQVPPESWFNGNCGCRDRD